MKDFITFLITNIIDKPESFKIEEEVTESGFTNYLISVDKDDMGKVIGKRGQIINALRTLIRVKAFQEDKKVILTLKEE